MTNLLDDAARRLRQAYSGPPIAPLRETLAPTDIDAAYAIQALNTRHWQDSGRRVIGRKIGLTAEAVQRQLGVDRPDFGVLFADMELGNGGVLPWPTMLQPKAEAEVALRLSKDLVDAGITAEDIAEAIEWACAAIEIVDSRIADWKITFADTVADNGSSAAFVLGPVRKPLEGLDLYTCGMALEIDGKPASVGAGAACLGHPLNAAAWLANTLVERGDPLRAGDIVLTGALGPMVALTPGMHVRALVGGLGEVEFTTGSAA